MAPFLCGGPAVVLSSSSFRAAVAVEAEAAVALAARAAVAAAARAAVAAAALADGDAEASKE